MSPLFVLSLFSALVGLVGCVTNPSDTAALRAFREQIGDTNNRLSNWNGNDPCGNSTNWEGVFCSPDSANVYHVTELRLLNHNLSGILAPELGNLTNLRILDVMWNTIAGSIPASIGNLRFLELLLLNGNNLSGPLPPELGNLKNMNRIQIDQNKISGPVPPTFGNLTSAKHFHMNNNSLDGNIPSDLGRLPNIVHILLDNNNLSGPLPPELSNLKTLLILQLDNNHFQGSIPQEYGSITTLFKMSLRNCALQGPVPDLSKIPQLGYLDLSYNRLNSTIPDTALAQNITSIDLSNNLLTGEIPTSFTNLPKLQALILNNNKLTGTVNASLIANLNTSSPMKLLLDFQNNSFSDVDPALRNNAANSFNLWLSGNPVCNIPINVVDGRLCGVNGRGTLTSQDTANDGTGTAKCDQMQCNPGVDELIPALALEGTCRCASPAVVEYRLKSPGFTFFDRYLSRFDQYISSGLNLSLEQVSVRGMRWESGPRLGLNIAIFPTISNDSNRSLSIPELRRIFQAFSGWNIPDDDVFGPYEFISFKPPFGIDLYGITGLHSSKSLSGGAIAGIIIGSFAVTGAFLGLLLFVLIRKQKRRRSPTRRKLIDRSRLSSSLKITGVREFDFKEMEEATDSFSESRIAGVGGYGKVYRGVLSDGQVVAIKRAQEGSLQGAHEFYTEIELLSRVHHRNLVALVGFCEDDEEQMLVYEYMEGGTLRERLSPGIKLPLDFATRLRIAIGSARGILYLHTEANPPIFHRDIKASNILLDSKNTAKVADFGLSKLAPIPDLEGITPAHVSTVVKGTPGYLDPEYFLTRKLTDKSDVYSFGVVLLELLTGMHPISQGKNIVREVNLSYHAGMVLGIVDERMGSYPAEALEPLMRLALGCCKEYTDERPSMADVVRDLEDIWKSMPWSDTYSNIEDHEHETGGGGGKKMGSGGSGGGGGGGVGGGKKMSSGGSGAAFNDYFRSSSADTSNNDASGIYSGTIKNLAPR